MHGDKYFKIIPSVSSSPCSHKPRPGGTEKRTTGLSRESQDNNARRKSPERRIERERERNRVCEDTARKQSKVGSRNIFENLNRLLETTGSECDDAYASIGRSLGRSGPEGEGGDRWIRRRRQSLFSRPLGRSRRKITRREGGERKYMRIINRMIVASGSFSLSFSLFLSLNVGPLCAATCSTHVHARAVIGQIGRVLREPSWRSPRALLWYLG